MVAFDMHAHVSVPAVDALVAEQPGFVDQQRRDGATLGTESLRYNIAHVAELTEALNDLELRLAAMDAAGVDVQAVSPIPIPHLWAGTDLASQIVATTNAYVAEYCRRAPNRLIGIAIASLQHPELAADQLTTAVVDHGLRGVQISTSAGTDRQLDYPDLERFWSRAEELQIPVLIHPWGCSLGERLNIAYMFNTVGNPTETTVALSRLIFGGVLDRHPGLRIWSAHGGGYLPSYTGRADHAWRRRSDAHTCRELPSSYLRKMWFDSLVFDEGGLRHLVNSVGVRQVTLGSDYPFDMGVDNPIARVRRSGLTDEVVTAICEGNAMSLLGLSSWPATSASTPLGEAAIAE
jgi:predicted TIM-barrel fold metal-dependent hydrolase